MPCKSPPAVASWARELARISRCNRPEQQRTPSGRRRYSAAEISLIRRYYVSHGAEFCQTRMPRRTIHSIWKKAEKLGVIRHTCEPWTQAENDLVTRGLCEGLLPRDIAKRLRAAGYRRTDIAVKFRAQELRGFVRAAGITRPLEKGLPRPHSSAA